MTAAPLRALPERFDAVLSGHIHRRQVLWRTRADGTRLPVVYAGSIERTSFAEQGEQKGFAVIELGARERERGRLRFVDLPARPMIELAHEDDAVLAAQLTRVPADAIVRVTCSGEQARRRARGLANVPPSVNVELRLRSARAPHARAIGALARPHLASFDLGT